ncbi:DEAD/DEAH box helicase [Gillisia sp. M10.2A]|uniref:DEAD/DEAH box helicase n=1 Tax=Gillisia lutea TaxID=2909668 RepID=A0ABS9EFA9_9FLAO|nr:DEAD/DEAH box helicase [Gillisia lutea]MCF4101556.1 DEAD/DEAH box helicase [Gillisia lutea]
MSNIIKEQKYILDKLGIEKLNPMQEEAHLAIDSSANTVLLSPTGTGKTLAFLLPIINALEVDCHEVQVLILVPSRELAIQIEQVTREMGSGYKANAVYGGRAFSKDKIELKHRPAILIGTPGRIADHLRRETFAIDDIKTLVLDEFDKSLEVGFEAEMSEIIEALPHISKRILTSATQEIEIPKFAGVIDPSVVNYLDTGKSQLDIKTVLSPNKDKLQSLVQLLCQIENEPGIIFCNFKDSIQRVSDYLTDHNISHGCFYGGMEQKDRERALIKFRNGTHQLIIATDLAARGIDIPEMKFIIHYQLPLKSQEFTHRNGRTARMNSAGTAYVLQWTKEDLPEFIDPDTSVGEIDNSKKLPKPSSSKWETIFISGGRKDKISKGDIAGLFLKQGNLEKNELGTIELKQDCAFVAVPARKVTTLIKELNNSRLKKKKVRLNLI